MAARSKGGSKASSNRQGAGAKSSNTDIDRMFDALGVRGSSRSGSEADVNEMLEKAKSYVNDQFTRAREFAGEHPRAVLSTLAGVVLGAGLLTAAAIRKGSSRKSSSKKSSGAKKSSGGKKSSSSKKSSSGKKSSR